MIPDSSVTSQLKCCQKSFCTRFEREAQIIAGLEHPAIVPVYDFGEQDSQPYLVMRLMTGGSLANRIKRGAFAIANSAYIISRIASALDEVHGQHRSSRPQAWQCYVRLPG